MQSVSRYNWYMQFRFDMFCRHGQIDHIEHMSIFHDMYFVRAQTFDIWSTVTGLEYTAQQECASSLLSQNLEG